MSVLVIKIGTSTLLDAYERPSGTFENIALQLKELQNTHNIVLVTSGAIGFGMRSLRLTNRPVDIASLQALSMLGQVGLMRRWQSAFSETALGQVLVTRRELHDPTDEQNFTESIHALWRYGALPVVNENDAVSTEEISFGDNDRLAAEIAVHLHADSLVLLTDQDGIQAEFGTPQQYRIAEASVDDIQQHIVSTTSDISRGGAASKLAAAKITTSHNIPTYVAHAMSTDVIRQALTGQSGTKIVQ